MKYTFTMKLNANNQRYLHIAGDYGTKAVYVVSLTVEAEKVKLPVYNFLEGADSSWTQNSNGTLTFRINGDFSKFTGVKVDDTLIDAKNYTAVSGSTVITLKTDYLQTFSVGTHKLTAVYTDGEAVQILRLRKQLRSRQNRRTLQNLLIPNLLRPVITAILRFGLRCCSFPVQAHSEQ